MRGGEPGLRPSCVTLSLDRPAQLQGDQFLTWEVRTVITTLWDHHWDVENRTCAIRLGALQALSPCPSLILEGHPQTCVSSPVLYQ